MGFGMMWERHTHIQFDLLDSDEVSYVAFDERKNGLGSIDSLRTGDGHSTATGTQQTDQLDWLPDDTQPLEAARWVYRRLETLYEDNALSEAAASSISSRKRPNKPSTRSKGRTVSGASKPSCGMSRNTARASNMSSAGGASSSPREVSCSRGSAA